MAHPRGFLGHFWLIWSRFPENHPKKLKFQLFAILAKFLLEWLENPLKIILGSKKKLIWGPGHEKWGKMEKNGIFRVFFALIDHIYRWSNLPGTVVLKWSFWSKSSSSHIKVDILAIKPLYFVIKTQLKSTKRVFVSDKNIKLWVKLTVFDNGSIRPGILHLKWWFLFKTHIIVFRGSYNSPKIITL